MDIWPIMTKRMNYFHQATFSTIHGNFGLVKVNFKKKFFFFGPMNHKIVFGSLKKKDF